MHTTADAAPAPAPPPRAGAREWLGLAVLVLPCLLLVVDITVLFLALPAIAADLGAGSAQQLWILDIYGFMVAGLLVTMGALGDRIGRRRLLMAGAAAFAAASAVAAFSTSAEMLIATRALLGVAGATVMPSTLALIRNLFLDPVQRGLAIAVWSSTLMAGLALGPVVGGIMLEWFWWGSVFLLGVPVMALVLIAGPFLLPEYRDPRPGRLNLASVVLSLMAILPTVYAIKDAANYGLRPSTAAALLVGLAFGWAFVRRQRTLADPLFDLSLFRHRVFSVGLGTMLVASTTMGAFGLLFAQYLQLVLGRSPGEAGLWMIPWALASVAGSLLTPRVAARLGDNRAMAAGLVVAAAGFGVYGLSQGGTVLALAVTGSVVVGLGMSPLIVLVNTIVLRVAPKEKSGSAASISETGAEVGASLGIALFGSLLAAVYRVRVELPGGLPRSAAETAEQGMPSAAAVADGLPAAQARQVLVAAEAAFTTGLAAVSYLSAAVSLVLALVALLFLKTRGGGPAGQVSAGGAPAEDGAAVRG